MGKTWGLRSSPRLDALVNFFLAFFFLHFFLFRKEVRMNLITSILSILCLVSLVAGIPANGYNRQRDFAGEEKDEANREADGEEPESAQPESAEQESAERQSAEPQCVEKNKECDENNNQCCEDAPLCVVAGGIGTGAPHTCREIPPEPPCIQKGKSCTWHAWAGKCCEDAPVCRSNPRPWYEIGRPNPYAPKFCRES